jgi:hypothetical protein
MGTIASILSPGSDNSNDFITIMLSFSGDVTFIQLTRLLLKRFLFLLAGHVGLNTDGQGLAR